MTSPKAGCLGRRQLRRRVHKDRVNSDDTSDLSARGAGMTFVTLKTKSSKIAKLSTSNATPQRHNGGCLTKVGTSTTISTDGGTNSQQTPPHRARRVAATSTTARSTSESGWFGFLCIRSSGSLFSCRKCRVVEKKSHISSLREEILAKLPIRESSRPSKADSIRLMSENKLKAVK